MFFIPQYMFENSVLGYEKLSRYLEIVYVKQMHFEKKSDQYLFMLNPRYKVMTKIQRCQHLQWSEPKTMTRDGALTRG